jgi:hypothetical protein
VGERAGYGRAESSVGAQSLSGATGLRKIYDAAGGRTYAISSLNSQSDKFNTIVWLPVDMHVPSTESILWFSDWLKDSRRRTLVYVGRDFSAEELYWSQGLAQAAPEDRVRFTKEKAFATATHDQIVSLNQSVLRCPWFSLQTRAFDSPVTKWTGTFGEDIDPTSSTMQIGSYLETIDSNDFESIEETISERIDELDSQIQGSVDSEPIAIDEEWLELQSNERDQTQSLLDSYQSIRSRVLLRADSGEPLVIELTHSNWGTNRILLLANASALLNVCLVNAENRKLAARLVADTCQDADRVAILTASNDVRIFSANQYDSTFRGFEMLTIWPLNIISLHALALGLVAMAALYPIFGRARRLRTKTRLDFGAHIQSLGCLLERGADRAYALRVVKNYLTNVRREQIPTWLENELNALPDSSKPTQTGPTQMTPARSGQPHWDSTRPPVDPMIPNATAPDRVRDVSPKQMTEPPANDGLPPTKTAPAEMPMTEIVQPDPPPESSD